MTSKTTYNMVYLLLERRNRMFASASDSNGFC